MKPAQGKDAVAVRKHWPATRSLVSSLFLVGVTVISLSFVPGEREVLRNIIRELGIVLVSVFGVSILYEIFIAEQHFEQFRGALVKIIQSGETNRSEEHTSELQ